MQLEVICFVAHRGVATRAQIESHRGDSETLLRRLVDRGLLGRVDHAPERGGPNRYRVTVAAIAATGHPTLESLQKFLADSVSASTLAAEESDEELAAS